MSDLSVKIFESSTSQDLQNQVNLFFRENEIEVVSSSYSFNKAKSGPPIVLDDYGLLLIYRKR